MTLIAIILALMITGASGQIFPPFESAVMDTNVYVWYPKSSTLDGTTNTVSWCQLETNFWTAIVTNNVTNTFTPLQYSLVWDELRRIKCSTNLGAEWHYELISVHCSSKIADITTTTNKFYAPQINVTSEGP